MIPPNAFEPLYELTKTNTSELWKIVEYEVIKCINRITYRHNLPYGDLHALAYKYFLMFCEKYNPFYNNNFYPFKASFFKSLIKYCLGNIQHLRFKEKRFVGEPFESVGISVEIESTTELIEIIKTLKNPLRTILLMKIKGFIIEDIAKVIGKKPVHVNMVVRSYLHKCVNYPNKMNENELKLYLYLCDYLGREPICKRKNILKE